MSRGKRRVSLVSLLVVGLLGLFGYGLTRDPYVLPSPLVGRPAPPLGLAVMPPEPDPDLERWQGRDTVHMDELEGRPLVINFWASWCLACREEHPHLSAAARRYRDDGVRFFGVLYQDEPPAARRFIRELGGQSYPTLLDPGSRVAIDYGVYGIPETYFIGSDGRMRHRHIGPVTTEILETRIDSLLAAESRTGTESPDTSPAPGTGGRSDRPPRSP